jgi:hypothetical protein
LGFHDIVIDADIVFLIFKIHKLQYDQVRHFFGLLKSVLKWRLLISEEVESEIEDPLSLALKEKLLKEGFLERFQPSNSQEVKEIAQAYKDLRRIMHKGEASCFSLAKCKGFFVLSHDHEAYGLLAPEIKNKFSWFSFYETIYLLNRESAFSDIEAQGYLDALGSLPDFTLPVGIRKTGFNGIKSLYDKKYGTRKQPPKPKAFPGFKNDTPNE